MKRVYRILLEIFGPAAIVSLGFTVFVMVSGSINALQRPAKNESAQISGLLQIDLLILIVAYIFAILPSALCCLLAEFMFSKGLSPASWRSVLVAGLLGTISGVIISLALGVLAPIGIHNFLEHAGTFFAFLGLITGLIIGLIIKWSERHN